MRNPLILFLLGILYSCHTQDQYRSVINFISSADDFCSEAQDFNSCQSLVDRCQPAFDESQNFAACVANPSEWSDTDDPEVSPRDETNPPSIGETLEVKCQISGKYLLNYSAVKLCHNNQTIVVSCNELSVHQKHQVAGDYIGACHQ